MILRAYHPEPADKMLEPCPKLRDRRMALD
jgi:hypothetical protein